MLLAEVSDLKISMLISSIDKLIDKGIKIKLETRDADGNGMEGEVDHLILTPHLNRSSKFYQLGYYELYGNVLEKTVSKTSGPRVELEKAKLKNNQDGTYTLYLPNAEVDNL